MKTNIYSIVEGLKKEMETIVAGYDKQIKSAEQYTEEYKAPIVQEAEKAYRNQTITAKNKTLEAIQDSKEKMIKNATENYFAPVDSEVLGTLTLLAQVKPSKKELEVLATEYSDHHLVMRRLAQIAKEANISLPAFTLIPTLDQAIEAIDSHITLAEQTIQSINEKQPNLDNLTFTLGLQALAEQEASS